MTRNLNQETKGRKSPSPTTRRLPKCLWLHVFPSDMWVSVNRGETILDALRKAKVELDGDCGGLGKCGKCKIRILSVTSPPTDMEQALLDEEELKGGIRLACCTPVTRDLAISLGEVLKEPVYTKILTTSHMLHHGYLPISQLNPLVEKRPVVLSPAVRGDGFSCLDCIKQGLGPEYSNLEASLQCLQALPGTFEKTNSQGSAILHDNYLLGWQIQEDSEKTCGLVFDLGTSTLVGKLIDLLNGCELAVSSCLNSQNQCGPDIISRLQYVKQYPEGLETLRHLLLDDLNNIIKHLLKTAGLEADKIFIAVAAGNTTMQHILLNLPPSGIAEAPFSPVTIDGMIVNAVDIGLQVNPGALLYTMPMKSGYVGGDLISFILASGVYEKEDEIILGLDLGTNGEIFLGNGKRLLTCSTAAGPAFEGARISSGMIARAGAIEGARHEGGNLYCSTIGNIKPKGLCGSGVVDLIAVLLHCGVIDHEGLIRLSPTRKYRDLNSRVIPQTEGYSFLVASRQESFYGCPVYITQRDVRELQLAKAAMAAGIKILMNELGVGPEDISRVYLAGALDRKSVV